MLIKRVVLDRIAAGEIDLVFRRQKRPTVKAGGTLRTAIGMLDIVALDRVDVDAISADEARRAGYPSAADLVAFLSEKPDGDVYRATVRLGGVDPREILRNDDQLADGDVATLRARLDRLDRGPRGPWTGAVLHLIAERPHVRAPDLAAQIGWETAPFKEHVRKLKALGLTISHSPGYELSPRGRAVLDRLGDA